MTSKINALTGSGGVAIEGDSSGILEFQSNGTTVMTVSSASQTALNKIINGNMLVAQRGTTGTAVAGGSYLACDRWKAWEASDAAVTVSQETDGPTGKFTKCLKYNITTADASITAAQFGMVRQMIEGHNIIDLGFGTASAQSVTISFWVKSSLTGSHGAALNNGNEDRSYPFAYTVSSANTWEYKTVTIPGDTSGTWDTDSTAGMIVTFGLGAGTDYQGTADAWQAGNKFQPSSTVQNIGTISNWNVTGVQLEAGGAASNFEQLQYGQQLALCYRYFERYNGGVDGGIPQGIAGCDSANRPEINLFYLEKRANPTITGDTTVNANTMANTTVATTGGPHTYVGTGPRGANLFYNVSSGVTPNDLSGITLIVLNGASDFINIDAEL